MFEIELPCCGTAALLDERANDIACESCGVVLSLDDPNPEALPLAA